MPRMQARTVDDDSDNEDGAVDDDSDNEDGAVEKKSYLNRLIEIFDLGCFITFELVTMFTVLLLSIIFESVGLFTPHWGYNSTCTEIGLVKTCCGNSTVTGIDALNRHVLGLHAFSYALILAIVLCCCFLCCLCYQSRYSIGNAMKRFFCPRFVTLLVFFSGFLNFTGCMIVRGMLPNMGYSFYMCLTASVLLMLTSLFFLSGYFLDKSCLKLCQFCSCDCSRIDIYKT